MLYNSIDDLKRKVEKVREVRVRRIIMVPGTFDLFHVGHLKIINYAKEYNGELVGDFVIVVVKSDNAAKLKKPKPPIICEHDRALIVSSIKGVDAAIIADYDPERPVTLPYENIAQYQWLNIFEPVVKELRPDIFVHNFVPELQSARDELFKKYGVLGKVFPRCSGISTTAIIERVQKLYGNDDNS